MARSPGANGRPAPEVLAQLAEEVLPTLIARLERSRLGELEVRQDGWRVRLRRTVPSAPDGADGAAVQPASLRRPDRRSERQADATEPRPQQLRPADRGMVDVTSPAVGYYLPRDGVAVGSTVRAGDTLGHIDVLGVRVEVVAPEDGLIAALSAESGEAVEYGQTLGRLERSRVSAEARS